MDWKQYLGDAPACGCGRAHRCDMEDVVIGSGIVNRLPELLLRHGYRHICVVSDVRTERAAGEAVKALLKQAGFCVSGIVFPEGELVPDERALGSVMVELPAQCDLIVAVGTGTLNDLCRFVSWRLNIPYYIVATAASMDGFASNGAPLIVKNLKTTYEIGRPRVIVGDLDFFCAAPREMTAAGIADILGKHVCLADWKMAAMVTGEYYCGQVEAIIRGCIDRVEDAAKGAIRGQADAMAALMEALVLSGVAINYVGNSRPCSGSEHHLSHYWEMQSLFSGSHGALHGVKVGVGTVLGLKLYRKLPGYLRELQPEQDLPAFSRAAWDAEIARAYGKAAPQVLRLEDGAGKNADNAVRARRRALKRHAAEIEAIVAALPEPEEMAGKLQKMGLPYLPEQIGVGERELVDSVLYAKDLRNRYGLLQILFDLGKGEEAAYSVLNGDW